ncbi:hypothetical protein [Ancylobacter vacuolatus]|uniref:Uncharacterized protein n=1 Tax=Ancylobacter vacuolatus TaxID=223389 RepID=A0ABU0DKY5_9HYPH|nr:hypothetical protein [Ancylobacter vacuolatus]MDQ0349098.1 hypothetical protein [Ancylobacter vacuolatus]
MTVHRAGDGTIYLDGACGSEEAEPLLALLIATPGATVDWQGCEQAHMAVVQVLLALRPQLRGVPASAFLARHVAPLLNRPPAGGAARLEA